MTQPRGPVVPLLCTRLLMQKARRGGAVHMQVFCREKSMHSLHHTCNTYPQLLISAKSAHRLPATSPLNPSIWLSKLIGKLFASLTKWWCLYNMCARLKEVMTLHRNRQEENMGWWARFCTHFIWRLWLSPCETLLELCAARENKLHHIDCVWAQLSGVVWSRNTYWPFQQEWCSHGPW